MTSNWDALIHSVSITVRGSQARHLQVIPCPHHQFLFKEKGANRTTYSLSQPRSPREWPRAFLTSHRPNASGQVSVCRADACS